MSINELSTTIESSTTKARVALTRNEPGGAGWRHLCCQLEVLEQLQVLQIVPKDSNSWLASAARLRLFPGPECQRGSRQDSHIRGVEKGGRLPAACVVGGHLRCNERKQGSVIAAPNFMLMHTALAAMRPRCNCCIAAMV